LLLLSLFGSFLSPPLPALQNQKAPAGYPNLLQALLPGSLPLTICSRFSLQQTQYACYQLLSSLKALILIKTLISSDVHQSYYSSPTTSVRE
jgi:hypothetical protein